MSEKEENASHSRMLWRNEGESGRESSGEEWEGEVKGMIDD